MRDIQRCIGTIGYLGGVVAVPEEFTFAWGEMVDFNAHFVTQPGELIHYTRAKMSLHAGARNFLAKELRGDWLIMLDTDQVFDPEIVLKLLTLHKRYHLPVLTGLSRHKAEPHHPLWWMWHAPLNGFIPLIEYDPTVDVLQIGACGGGCMLIHRSVFGRLAERFPDEDPFDHRGRHSEDFSFALRCLEADIPIFATPQVQAHHLVTRRIDDTAYIPNWFGGEIADLQVAAGGGSDGGSRHCHP